MKTVLDEFNERRQQISHLRVGDDQGRPANLLVWMEAQPEINRVLAELRHVVDVDKLISPHGFPPRTSDQTDVIAIGLYLLDEAKAGHHLFQTAIRIGIRGYGGSNGQNNIEEALESYINPLLDHVVKELESSGERVMIEDVIQLRFGILGDDFSEIFPATSALLQKTATYCAQPEEQGSWFHVATSCRELLQAFVGELVAQGAVVPAPELKQGDAKGILKQLIKQKPTFSETLIDLVQAVWVYVSANVHRQSATKQDALRAYLWTGLLMSEVWLLVQAQLKAP